MDTTDWHVARGWHGATNWQRATKTSGWVVSLFSLPTRTFLLREPDGHTTGRAEVADLPGCRAAGVAWLPNLLAGEATELHVASVLAANFEERIGDLTQRTYPCGVHQDLERIILRQSSFL